ncbi:MAG: hypothetical protein IKQ46_11990 [Bacteroidales bacterium]|nr:hypothetical protein [Bacteroidales bacterium]
MIQLKSYMLILFLLLTSICYGQDVNLKVDFSGNKIPEKIYFQNLIHNSRLDSIEFYNSKEFSTTITTVRNYQFFRLIVNNEKMLLIIQPGENISVNYNTDIPLNSTISGSSESEILINGLKLIANTDSAKLEAKLLKFIKLHPKALANIVLIEFLDFNKNFDFIKSISEQLTQDVPAVNNLKDRILAHEILKQGTRIQDFEIPNIENGKTVKPSDFQGNDFSIIFFAAWNKKSLNYLQNYIKRYPNKKIMAISLDGDRQLLENEVKSIKNQQIVVCSEFKYFDSEIVNKFQITKLPFTIEINEKGIIQEVK